ncbi:phage tail spike protein [Peribacillus muralis]|uniref:phage tail spike protein n=1 Tax=Peribacillus muralis TaxID=264697 RepID=UPI003CFE6D24
MYIILDSNLKVCGVLDLEGSQNCKFYNDLRTTKIADEQGKIWSDTLTISVPYGYPQTAMMTEGYHLLKQAGDGLFYCYRIYNWQDGMAGSVHVKTVQAYNLCIWDLYHKIVPGKSIFNANSSNAFEYILQGTGWEIGTDDFFGGEKTVEFSEGQTAQAHLDSLINQFGVEVRAYVQIYNGQVIRKLIDIVDELGESTGRRLEYAHDIEGLTRTGDDMEFYTKLHVYGGSDKDGKQVSIASVNGGRDYILDEKANDLYNNGNEFLEGYLVNEDILNPSGLLDWGKKQMDKYNHPKYTYEVDVAHLGYQANLGDHIGVVDFSMQPELTISARILQVEESEANPENTKYTLGEFVEIVAVTPADIWALQAKASQAAQAAAQAKSYKIDYFTPDGIDFSDGISQKRIIIRVYLGMEDVTAQIDRNDYVWQKINADGSHDSIWEAEHIGIGNVITIGNEAATSTIRCQVQNGISGPIIFAEETDAAFFASLQLDAPSGWDDFSTSVAQYAQVDHTRKNIYWSQKYWGSKRYSGDTANNIESYVITRTDLGGKILDRMWAIRGGHGAQFGIEYINNQMWIWSCYRDVKNDKWHVVKFPYKANKVLDWGDSSIVDLMVTPGSSAYLTNLDVRNGYVLFAIGSSNPNLLVCKKSDILAGQLKPIYTMLGTDINFFGSTQTYQSTCLDFPYLYLTSGSVNSSKNQRVLYCADIRSKSLVYRIVYTFDKGTIEKIGIYDEPEAISYYYDDSGKKWVIQGFAFGNEDAEDSQRLNHLYRINEHKRGE